MSGPVTPRGAAGAVARGVVGGLLPRAWRTRVTGLEHLPARGPVILAANHTGLLDGPLVWGVLPRDVRFLVKDSMFTGLLGALLRATRQVPIDPSGGRSSLAALQHATEVLRAGGAVGVFPEGTRGRGDVAEVRSGVAWLALRTGAPVVPVAVLGTEAAGRGPLGALPRPRALLRVALAAPVRLGAGRRPAEVAAAAAVLREVLAAHVARTAGTGGTPVAAVSAAAEPDPALRATLLAPVTRPGVTTRPRAAADDRAAADEWAAADDRVGRTTAGERR